MITDEPFNPPRLRLKEDSMQAATEKIPSSRTPAADAPPPHPLPTLAQKLEGYGPGKPAPEYTKEDDEIIRALFSEGLDDEGIAEVLRTQRRPWQTAAAVGHRRAALLLYRQTPRSKEQRKRLAGKKAAETRSANKLEAAPSAPVAEEWILGQVGDLRFEVRKDVAADLIGWIDNRARLGKARLRLDGDTIKKLAGLT